MTDNVPLPYSLLDICVLLNLAVFINYNEWSQIEIYFALGYKLFGNLGFSLLKGMDWNIYYGINVL